MIIRNFLVSFLFMSTALSVWADEAFDHGQWNSLLSKYVLSVYDDHATQVSYVGMDEEKVTLEGYLARISGIERKQFDHWSKQDQLAFLINAYNAWTVKLILSDYRRIESIKDLGSIFRSPWKKDFIPLLGSTVSLDYIEHDLIRGSGRYNDWRIHFAVNCASIGCPALRNEAYTAAQLDEQLEDQTKRFLADRTRNRIEGNTLKLSSIFKWYKGDFEKGWLNIFTLAEFIVRYANSLALSPIQISALQRGDITIDYLNYDWKLNNTFEKTSSESVTAKPGLLKQPVMEKGVTDNGKEESSPAE
jgi:hypothetical protein